MGMFRAKECKLQAEGDFELATELAGHVKKEGLPVTMSTGKKVEMDHASFVPLYYLSKAWKSLPKLVLANPLGLSYEQSYFLGRALRRLELKDKRRALSLAVTCPQAHSRSLRVIIRERRNSIHWW